MTNSNRIKLTWISFFSYALTGALVIVTGMVMGNIADYFHLPVSSMSNTFTFLNAGILISIFLNAWLMEIVPLKTQLRFGFVLMVAAVAGLMLSHSIALFSAAMFVLGLVSGITMSIGTFLITHMYEGRQRGARLLSDGQGSLLVGALKFRYLARLTLQGGQVAGEEKLLQDLGERIRAVRQGPDGLIYLLTDSANGQLLRLMPR